ncbi:hypothetical protein M513_05539 [Trichuris suis]|uniref:Uncharacterized protein n=1 Tax=Trichuris suis TaxID=68888 RepID=A0A085M8S7_9BILA|nr:hypothetical protein M513_05539 [Trichuris suis]
MPGPVHSRNPWTTCGSSFATTIVSSIVPHVLPCNISRIIRCFISCCLLIVCSDQHKVSLRMSTTSRTESSLLCRCSIINMLNGFQLKLQRSEFSAENQRSYRAYAYVGQHERRVA